MKLTRRMRITGRVQGVGYREAMCDTAVRLGVSGWVRNRADGSVEAVAHGSPQAVDGFIAWARRGPPSARVTEVEVSDDRGDYRGFAQLPST